MRTYSPYLQIETKAYWEQILWLGPDNWGGILLVEEIEIEDEEEEEGEGEGEGEGGLYRWRGGRR